MVIVVNTRFVLDEYLEGYGYFTREIFSRLPLIHKEHEFVFIYDRPYKTPVSNAANCQNIIAGPAARHPLLWKFWFDVTIPSLLKKFNADVFVSCDGFCSLRTKVPQCLVVHDLAFIHYPTFIPRSHLLFYKRYTPKFISKAKSLITVSNFSANDISTQFGTRKESMAIIPNAAKEIFKPVDENIKEKIKSKYTSGCEYFIYTGSIHPRKNLFNLLKAFSLFKKKQKSNTRLVIAGRLAWKYRNFTESLKSYKYREEVILTGYLPEEELALLVASAYALVYPSFFEGFGVPVLEAMQCQVPVLTSKDSAMQEIAGSAALYASPHDYEEIANNLMLIYKDEQLRQQMINSGKTQASNYNWEKSASLFWDEIMRAGQ